jgi:hypothetical protein
LRRAEKANKIGGFRQYLTNRGGARLVSGHGFSHAEKVQELKGVLTPEVLFPF